MTSGKSSTKFIDKRLEELSRRNSSSLTSKRDLPALTGPYTIVDTPIIDNTSTHLDTLLQAATLAPNSTHMTVNLSRPTTAVGTASLSPHTSNPPLRSMPLSVATSHPLQQLTTNSFSDFEILTNLPPLEPPSPNVCKPVREWTLNDAALWERLCMEEKSNNPLVTQINHRRNAGWTTHLQGVDCSVCMEEKSMIRTVEPVPILTATIDRPSTYSLAGTLRSTAEWLERPSNIQLRIPALPTWLRPSLTVSTLKPVVLTALVMLVLSWLLTPVTPPLVPSVLTPASNVFPYSQAVAKWIPDFGDAFCRSLASGSPLHNRFCVPSSTLFR